MATFVKLDTEEGPVLIEVDSRKTDGYQRFGDSEEVTPEEPKRPVVSLDEALRTIAPVAKAFVRAVKEAQPDEMELTFGLKFSGSAGIFGIAKVATDAQYEMKLTWKKSPDK